MVWLLKSFVYKSFVPFSSNSILCPEDYLQPLVEAARSHCFVENTGDKADSLHRRIKQVYCEDYSFACQRVMTPLIKKLRLGSVMLAIDSTTEDFYGEHADLFLRGWTGEKGVQAHYHFAVLSLVGKQKIPLLAIPWDLSMNHADMVKTLLVFAKKLFPYIRCILLDAGFYSGEVIEVLGKTKYIIRAKKLKNVEEGIIATNNWQTWSHTITWNDDKSTHKTTTNIVVVRKVRFKKSVGDCCFATNMQLSEGMDYVYLYIKRWQIETNFRMQDQVNIKSKSLHIEIRYFYFLISMLLHAYWLVNHAGRIALDKFKIHLANQLSFESIGLAYAYAVI